MVGNTRVFVACLAVAVFLLLLMGALFLLRQGAPHTATNSPALRGAPTVSFSVSDPRLLVGDYREDVLATELQALYGPQEWTVYENKNGVLTARTVRKLDIRVVDTPQPWLGLYLGQKDLIFSRFDVVSEREGEATLLLYLEPQGYSDDVSFSNAANLSLRIALFAVGNWESYSAHDEEWLRYSSEIIERPPIVSLVRSR